MQATKFNGQPVQLMRRDLRPGQQRAVAQRVGPGGVRVAFDWGDPNAGGLGCDCHGLFSWDGQWFSRCSQAGDPGIGLDQPHCCLTEAGS